MAVGQSKKRGRVRGASAHQAAKTCLRWIHNVDFYHNRNLKTPKSTANMFSVPIEHGSRMLSEITHSIMDTIIDMAT
jgi:hypothetical protein